MCCRSTTVLLLLFTICLHTFSYYIKKTEHVSTQNFVNEGVIINLSRQRMCHLKC